MGESEMVIWRCDLCGSDDTRYMVVNSLWNYIARNYTYLCLRCLEGLLQRKLVLEDFTRYYINKEIRKRYATLY